MIRFFVICFGVILVYGSFLFFQKMELSDVLNNWQKGKYNTLAEASKTQETNLVKQLSVQNNPILKHFSKFKLNLLNTSFIPKVEKGKSNWLFLAEEEKGRNVIHQSLGIRKYTPLEMKAWQLYFEQRAAWLSQKNIDYLLLFVPNKATVYPEYLPERYQKINRTSLDQLKESLPGVNIIDLRDSLINKKNKGQLYLANDTHWNELGAFYAAQSILYALSSSNQVVSLDLEQIIIQEESKKGGDLARLLLLEEERIESSPKIELKSPSAQFATTRSVSLNSGLIPKVYLNTSGKLAKTLFLHDSFLKTAIPFLAEHFQESVFLWEWQGFDIELIEREKPTLVVDQFVERATIGARKRNNWWVIQSYWQEHFSKMNLSSKSFDSSVSEIGDDISVPISAVDFLPILRIQFDIDTADKLIVTYQDDTGYYPLWKGTNEIFLQIENGFIPKIRLESEQDIRLNLEVRNY